MVVCMAARGIIFVMPPMGIITILQSLLQPPHHPWTGDRDISWILQSRTTILSFKLLIVWAVIKSMKLDTKSNDGELS